MAKKLSGRTLATSLIPNRLHKTEFDPDCNLNVRYPFCDDDPVVLSFQEVVDMLERAREMGKLEAAQSKASVNYQLGTGRPVSTRLAHITRRLLKKAS